MHIKWRGKSMREKLRYTFQKVHLYLWSRSWIFVLYVKCISRLKSKSKARLPSHLIQRDINILSKPKGNIYWNRGKFPKADRVYILLLLGPRSLEGNVLQALQPSMDLLGFLHRQISLCLIHIFFIAKRDGNMHNALISKCTSEWSYVTNWEQNVWNKYIGLKQGWCLN